MGNSIKNIIKTTADDISIILSDKKNENTLNKFIKIEDKYLTLEHISEALRKAGIEGSNLIFGIDYTSSNLEQGARSFNGMSLHTLNNNFLNPYQYAITLCGKVLETFDEDKLIPSYGFGDIRTKNFKVFNINKNNNFCYTFNEVLKCYNEITPNIKLSGPTSFQPIIKQAIEIIKFTRSYHILVIITDGEVIDKVQTENAIVEASNYPLSIIVIGVGDGPFDNMEKYDDELPKRKFDNFQFVNYNKIFLECQKKNVPFESIFMLHALQEIPDQYDFLKKNNMLNYTSKVSEMNNSYEYIDPNINYSNVYPSAPNF